MTATIFRDACDLEHGQPPLVADRQEIAAGRGERWVIHGKQSQADAFDEGIERHDGGSSAKLALDRKPALRASEAA